MAPKQSFLFVLCSLLALFASSALATQDPELKQCAHQCKHQESFTEKQQEQCIKKCEDYVSQKTELRQCLDRCEKQEEKKLDQCRQQCQYKFGEQELIRLREKDPRKEKIRECRELCKEEQSEKAQRRCEDECREDAIYSKKKQSKEEEEEEENNPFVFEDEDFTTMFKTEQGRVGLLQKFTERSKLLRGIENFRIGVLEANPRTFVVPAHFDADCLFVVVKGRASVTLVREKKQSFNLKCGDIFRVPAGIPVYMTNRDDKEKLFIVKLIQPVSIPGHFEAFYGPGGKNPESFYTAFSWELLEAALKTPRDKLKRIFGQQQEGGIIKATKEQIQALSPSSEGPGVWPFGSDSKSPFNLLDKRPVQSNDFGELFEADFDDYKPLKDLDVVVAFANITKGAMAAPYYNSRATKIAFVLEGEGYMEMACPHISSSSSSSKSHQKGQSFEKISSPLKQGTVFVAPAGHPLVVVASKNKNLQVLCFEVNAKDNIRVPLAGKKNIISEMDDEAKALSFNIPAGEVDKVFENQNEEFFFPGPKQRTERGFDVI